ncbi:aldehyde dehydrogenase family protein [Dactylosporangium sp. NPDC000521]|uniref:aldehyde dehydrogenase family protein n=1 Tax=Dactylosporangium sp. NPDC000521 TaxID=3363975 RepID=UPI0036BDE840
MEQIEQYIAGGWTPGSGSTTFTVLSPVDGAEVSRAPQATAGDVDAAVKGARAALPRWARTAPAARSAALRRAADAVAAAADRLAALMRAEMGKPVADARESVEAGVGTLRQYAELGQLHGGRTLAGDPGAIDLMVREPRGVVAAITPWNDPVAVSCGLLGAALVTGNTVVYKPSERTPATGWELTRVLAAALPEGVLSLVTGDGRAGAALAASPDVAVVAHVGSTAAGRAIAAGTAAKVLLENGGSDALIVDAGVDPGWAAGQAALGAFANSGQICVAVERIYVHRDIAGPFVDALVAEAGAWAGRLGPLVDARHREQVHAQVTAAVAAGAEIRCGGEIPPGAGAHYPPTVLTGCTDEMAVVAEETFGPVAPVVVVDGFEAALDRASRSAYGLAATVLTGSMHHAQTAWRTLDVGTVKVNAVFGGAPGGAAHPRRGSGQGFGYGPELLDEFTAVKVVHLEQPPTGW